MRGFLRLSVPASLHRMDSLCGVVELFRGRGGDRRSSPGVAVVPPEKGRKTLNFTENSLYGRHADIGSVGAGEFAVAMLRRGKTRCGSAALTALLSVLSLLHHH